MKNSVGFGSLCVHESKDKRTTRPHQLPIYATSSFEFESIDQGINIFKGEEKGHVYGRYGNPTIEAVAEKIAHLETHGLDMAASGLLVSSGMSAISTLMMGCLQAGDKVLTQGNLYGGTTELLLKIMGSLGVETLMCNLQQLDQVEQLLRSDPAIKMLYFETPANPTMACVDIEALSQLAQQYQCLTAIDNTFCTPYLQQPFRFGVDFIIHSTTKFLNGHGNSIAGAIIGRDAELMRKKVWQAMKLIGTNCNPFDAWLINNGLKTLELRMQRHSSNALAVAQFLEQHPKVSRVNYNGLPSHPDHELAKKQMRAFGGMLSFELQDGLQAGIDFMNRIQFCTLAPTLGDVDTLVLHPASSSHINVAPEVRLRNGITDGLIRLSVGIENPEDIIGDLEQALAPAVPGVDGGRWTVDGGTR
ncbi:MAG: aminotransferase class I/II-fold pyridoxal phosphate-dependent enzyme [Bacteroidota bacterium]